MSNSPLQIILQTKQGKALAKKYKHLKWKVTPFEKRFGEGFAEFYDFIDQTQWWAKEKLEEYQLKQLKKLLSHAYQNVPYYHSLFNKLGLKPKDFTKLEDLAKLPILTKDDVRQNHAQLIAQNFTRGDWIESHTSGSTGNPLEFNIDKESFIRELAFGFRAWTFGSYKLGDEVVTLRSYVPKKDQPLYFLDEQYNFLYMSAYDLTDKIMAEYVKVIEDSNSTILRGYPSSVYIFANYLLQKKKTLPMIKTVITSSESLLPQYREVIEKAFDTKVLDWYGCNERVITIQQCPENDGYHTNADYGILEVVDKNGKPIESGTGNIIGTNLYNYSMPLIRYQTNDIGVKVKPHLCKCGRGLPIEIVRIDGRSDEILTFAGLSVPPINFYTLFHETPNIKQFQLIQKNDHELLANIITTKEFNDANLKEITEGLRQRLGKTVKIEIKIVNEIPRDLKTGKVRCIINQAKK